MRWRRLSVSIAALLVTAGCGSTSQRSVTVEAITRATSKANTAELAASYDFRFPDVRGRVHVTLTGDADFANDAIRVHDELAGTIAHAWRALDVVGIGRHLYFRPPIVQPLRGAQHDGWCSAPNDSRNTLDLPFSPTSVLTSLQPSIKLQRVGQEVVRGIDTTRYRISGSPEWSFLWIDNADRLRRLTGHDTDIQGLVFDIFDYGAQVAPITAPKSVPCFSPSP